MPLQVIILSISGPYTTITLTIIIAVVQNRHFILKEIIFFHRYLFWFQFPHINVKNIAYVFFFHCGPTYTYSCVFHSLLCKIRLYIFIYQYFISVSKNFQAIWIYNYKIWKFVNYVDGKNVCLGISEFAAIMYSFHGFFSKWSRKLQVAIATIICGIRNYW